MSRKLIFLLLTCLAAGTPGCAAGVGPAVTLNDSDSLSPESGWATDTNTAFQTASANSVTFQVPTNGCRFFRLRGHDSDVATLTGFEPKTSFGECTPNGDRIRRAYWVNRCFPRMAM